MYFSQKKKKKRKRDTFISFHFRGGKPFNQGGQLFVK